MLKIALRRIIRRSDEWLPRMVNLLLAPAMTGRRRGARNASGGTPAIESIQRNNTRSDGSVKLNLLLPPHQLLQRPRVS